MDCAVQIKPGLAEYMNSVFLTVTSKLPPGHPEKTAPALGEHILLCPALNLQVLVESSAILRVFQKLIGFSHIFTLRNIIHRVFQVCFV